MLELPEVLNISKQLREHVNGKKVVRVLPPTKPHKFCWFNGEPTAYEQMVKGSKIISAEGFGIFGEIGFENGYKLCFNDGVNIRLMSENEKPKDFQLLIALEDGQILVFTVAMYGGIFLHDGSYDNEYYLKSKQGLLPMSQEFLAHYYRILEESKGTLSAKALLATEQRFPGIGNGTAQDILFKAGLHPKRKISTFSQEDKERLLESIKTVVSEMIEAGGRDTEKNIWGSKGGYQVKMSKEGMKRGCPNCGGEITKETYLGGSIYYCSQCQPLIKEEK